MAAGSAEEMFRNQPLSLQLIDFGRAIDLTLLPKDIFFTQVVKTDGIKNIEMREGKPWREQIDYFGVCATAYCLLFGTYMEVVKVGERWEVKGSYKRWWQVDMWKQFFNEFLNIKGLEKVCIHHLLKLVFIILFSFRNISLTFPSGVLGSSKYSLKRTWPSCCRG